MNKIRLMPVGSLESIRHLYDTIINPVKKNLIKNYISKEDILEISKISQGEEVAIWGLEPGKNNNQVWSNLEKGEILIFVPSNQDLIISELIYKVKNKGLAEKLWGISERSGQLWEMLLFVKIRTFINLDKRKLLTDLGYEINDNLQGNREVTDKFLEEYGSINSFIEKYHKEDINWDYFKNITPEEMFKRNVSGSSVVGGLTRSEREELKSLNEEITKLENLEGVPGFPNKEQIEEKKRRKSELEKKQV